ncbi:YHS domain-containing protein [Planctomicrobium piriforme]|uniref:YHS domain-containing protein n=1 Tax=Planctomicrobium piriforme TaxID=1576369 RepID=A0A1I3C2S5_9PLAN|nr:YHS domain-containing protein [Planctomicrobium piriforme]SFH68908.1 YHS domain-containing protein [Planctomicrobium piriforme]
MHVIRSWKASRPWLVLIFLLAISTSAKSALDEPAALAARQQLETFNGVIGEWRGTGQLRRGSTQGAWRETGEFVWDFSQALPAIRYVIKDGKQAASGRITWNAPAQQFDLALQTLDAGERQLSGTWKGNELAFSGPADASGVQHRVTITVLNEKRVLVLFEKTTPNGQAFVRVAEVGYTREGTHLADAGATARECVVTGGTGTMTVSYKGETYYVCCTGCRQAFEADPEKIIAEFKERIQKRQK